MVTSKTPLISCHILEKDTNNDLLWTWIFPKLPEENRKIILQKCNIEKDTSTRFVYGRMKDEFFNSYIIELTNSSKLNRIKAFALIVCTKDFNPDKYETLCRILARTYSSTGSPVEMQKLFLSAYIKGTCENAEEIFILNNMDYLKNRKQLKEFIMMFNLEIVLIYTAMLLKKRIIIYHSDSNELLKWIKILPGLMVCRDPATYLLPFIDLKNDFVQLKSKSFYVAGCTDSVVAKSDFYDLLVDLSSKEITIAPKSKDVFAMTKVHKDIAVSMVDSAKNPILTDEHIIKELQEKTNELLKQLHSLATVNTENGMNMISLEILRSKKFNPTLENFLFNLAMAESIMML